MIKFLVKINTILYKGMLLFFAIILSFNGNLFAVGKVLLVLGSDTAIWDGMV